MTLPKPIKSSLSVLSLMPAAQETLYKKAFDQGREIFILDEGDSILLENKFTNSSLFLDVILNSKLEQYQKYSQGTSANNCITRLEIATSEKLMYLGEIHLFSDCAAYHYKKDIRFGKFLMTTSNQIVWLSDKRVYDCLIYSELHGDLRDKT